MRRVAALAVALAALTAGTARAAGPAVPPPVDAKAFLVIDAGTGSVLASSNAHERVQIASLTKLMTVLLTFQHHKLSDVVTVDPRAAAVGQSSAYLVAGEQLTVHDLLEAALIQSANDAADALALSIAPSFPAFAKLMNREAAKLGLRDTHYVRPDGLDAPGEYSSAADVTKLARILMRRPFFRATVARETATIAGGEVLHTWNDLLGVVPHVIGVKTGHTDEAGWCQVAAERDEGVTVYVTVLGGPSRTVRNEDLESLLAWGVAQFRVVEPVQPGATYATVAVPYGRSPLRLVARGRLRISVRVGAPLVERVVAPAAARLPVRRGEQLGRIGIWSRGRLLGTRPLVAARTIRRPGLSGRLTFYAGRAAHHLAHLFR
jgi:serine-type D-Ala-D-Ala carboxypeptidase (penicillin-binding protein 5/6)